MKLPITHAALRFACLLSLACLPVAGPLWAHGGHKSQAPGIIDPLVTHHAVLEDELKLNYAGSQFDEEGVSEHTGSLELAYAASDLLGIELFIPYGATSVAGSTDRGIGDVDLLLPKVSFVRDERLVMTTYVAVAIPTADRPAGADEATWVFAPHLLVDFGVRNFGIQGNAAVEYETDGAVALEGNASLAYTLTLSSGSKMSVSPLVELNVEAPVRGEESGELFVAVTPGVKFGWGGWHLGTGVQLPVSDAREFDFRAMAQVGYHVTWGTLLGGS